VVSRADGIRTRLLVAVAIVVGGASWVILKLVASGGRELPSTSWLAVFIFIALALGLFVAVQVGSGLVLGLRLPLNAVALFVGLLLWWYLWGIPGAILAVPMMVAMKIVCDHVERLAPVGAFLGP